MLPNTKTIKNQFKKSFDKYDQNASIQKESAKILVENIPPKAYSTVLELGSGTGILTKYFSNLHKFEQYYANDLVEKSESCVKKYIPESKFFCGDFRKIKFNQTFDLILSNAVFQWCDNLNYVFDLCKTNLKINGIFAFSTFSPENYKEIKQLTGLTLEYKTKDEIISSLEKDFTILKAEELHREILFDNPLKILAHMKNTGVNSLSENKLSITEIKNFCEKYQQLFPNLQLTYSPIIVIAELK